MEIINIVGLAIVLFASTNIDDIFLLLVFFSGKGFRTGQIVLGQYLGICALFVVSVVAALVSLAFRHEYVGLLGFLPVVIGIRKFYDLRRATADNGEPKAASTGNILSVAAITIANGGDNISIYTPVFATSGRAAMIVFCIVFAVMVAVWLLFAHWLVNHPALGAPIRRYSDRVVPIVLILLGIYILYEAGSLALLASTVR